MSQIPMPEIDIGEAIMTAVNELGGTEGASFVEIKQYLTSTLHHELDSVRIQSSLHDAVEKRRLSVLPNGNYQMKGSRELAQEARLTILTEMVSRNAKMKNAPESEVAQETDSELDKYFMSNMGNEREKAEETVRRVQFAEDANPNAESDAPNIMARHNVSSSTNRNQGNCSIG